jgi:hypothetical protein
LNLFLISLKSNNRDFTCLFIENPQRVFVSLSFSQITCKLPSFLHTSLIQKRIVVNNNSFHSCYKVSFLSTLARRLFSQSSQENDLRQLRFDVEFNYFEQALPEFSWFTCTSFKIRYNIPIAKNVISLNEICFIKGNFDRCFFRESRPMKKFPRFWLMNINITNATFVRNFWICIVNKKSYWFSRAIWI